MGKRYQRSKFAETTGLGKEILRYYESRNIINPSREPGNGYRLYTEDDLTNLIMLKIKRSFGYSLEEAAGGIPGFGDPDWEQHLRRCEDDITRQIRKLERIRQIYEDLRELSEKTRNDPSFFVIEDWNDELYYLKQMLSNDICSDKKTDYAVKEIAAEEPIAFYGMKVGCEYLKDCSVESSCEFEEYGCFWRKTDMQLLPETDLTGLNHTAYSVKTVCRTVITQSGDNADYYAQQERIFRILAEKGYRVASDIIYRILPQSMDSGIYFFEMIVPVEKT